MRNVRFTVLILVLLAGTVPVPSWGSASPARAPAVLGEMTVDGNLSINGTVYITGNITVAPGGSLRFEEATVYFNLSCDGCLYLDSRRNSTLSVLNSTFYNSWNGANEMFYRLRINGTALIRNSVFWGVWGDPAAPDGSGGMEIYSSGVTVTNSTVRQPRTNGFLVRDSSPWFSGVVVDGGGDDGFEVIGGILNIFNTTVRNIAGTRGAGVRCTPCGTISIVASTFTSVPYGVVIADGIYYEISGNTISASRTGVSIASVNGLVPLMGNRFTAADAAVEVRNSSVSTRGNTLNGTTGFRLVDSPSSVLYGDYFDARGASVDATNSSVDISEANLTRGRPARALLLDRNSTARLTNTEYGNLSTVRFLDLNSTFAARVNLTVRVEGTARRPVAGATVRVLDGSRVQRAYAVTDTSGQARFPLPGVEATWAVTRDFNPYTVEVTVDNLTQRRSLIAEGVIGGLTTVFTFSAGDAAVYSTDISVSPSRPDSGVPITVRFSVRGDFAALTTVPVAVFSTSQPDPVFRGAAVFSTTVKTQSFSFEWTFLFNPNASTTVYPTSGTPYTTYTFTFAVDDGNTVNETREDNNMVKYRLDVFQPRTVNIAVLSGSLSPPQGEISEDDQVIVTVYITVTQGAPLNSSVPVQFIVDGEATHTTSVYLRTTAEVRYVWKATPGTHTVRVVADPDNSIAETSESDNSVTLLTGEVQESSATGTALAPLAALCVGVIILVGILFALYSIGRKKAAVPGQPSQYQQYPYQYQAQMPAAQMQYPQYAQQARQQVPQQVVVRPTTTTARYIPPGQRAPSTSGEVAPPAGLRCSRCGGGNIRAFGDGNAKCRDCGKVFFYGKR